MWRLFLFVSVIIVCSRDSESAEIWIDVPFVKQNENGCGAAVISMVLQYWAVANPASSPAQTPDLKRIEKELYSESAKGIYAADMSRFFEELGFRAFIFSGSWNDLEHHIARGRPLILALGPDGEDGRLHYVVVAGIDIENQTALVNDSARRKLLKMKRTELEESWKSTRQWTLLAVPEK